ncbi:hypothetical protein [Sneathiella sp.]|uniref:hypothetical protein n=1 Tax=Sneathiella sp. TaxID=1964365 RepID=UPI00356AE67A
MKTRQKDIEKILKDPSAVYDTPHDVYHDENLTFEAKSAILEGWEEDVKGLLRADSENMSNPDSSSNSADLLKKISELRAELEKTANNDRV